MKRRPFVLLAVCSPEVAGYPRPSYGGRHTLPFDESNRAARPGAAATPAATRPPPPFSPLPQLPPSDVGAAEHALPAPTRGSTRSLAHQWDEWLPSGSPPQLPSPPLFPPSPPAPPSPPSPPPPPPPSPPPPYLFGFCYPCTGPISWEVLNFAEAITGGIFLFLVLYYVCLWVPAGYIWVDPDWQASMQGYLVAAGFWRQLRRQPRGGARYLAGATEAGAVVAPPVSPESYEYRTELN